MNELVSSPNLIVIILEPSVNPDFPNVGVLMMYPTGTMDVYHNGELVREGEFETCIPAEEFYLG